MAAKKIAITEQPEEATVKVHAPADTPVVKEEQPDTNPEPAPQEPSDQPPAPEPPSEEVKPPVTPPEPPAPTRTLTPRKRRKFPAWIVFIGIVLVVIIGVYLHLQQGSSPLPSSVTKATTFTVYYPKPMVNGYKYVAGSSNYSGGILTYTLQSAGPGGPMIRVSEEAKSGQGPDLSKLPNFSVFQAPAGEAAVGVNGGVINGILVTQKTVIILNGIGGVSMQDFMQLINNMKL